MPRWLKRDHSFRKWYTHTRLKRDRRLAWNQLFDIYRWETSLGQEPTIAATTTGSTITSIAIVTTAIRDRRDRRRHRH